MDVRSLVLTLGFSVNKTSMKIAEQSVQDLKKKLEEAGVAAEKVGDNMANSASKAAKATNVQSRLMASLTKSTKDANNGVSVLTSKLNGLLAFAGVSLTVGSLVNLIDEWKVVEGQVNNVTKSEKESKAVQNEIYQIASRTRQQYKSTAELYTSVARNAQELKKSTKDILLFTEDVSNAMLLGGGSAASQEAALVQLGQALGSGVLRGDELNSILEQAPRLAKAIAEGMGTTIGNLRQMGQEGKLTAEDVFKAIRSQSDRLKMELGKMPWTFGQAANKMQNAVGLFFKKFEDKQGVIDTLAKSIAKVADYIEKIDVSRFIAGFRVAAVYAASLFAVSRWGAMVAMALRFWKTLMAIRNAFLLVMGVQIAFQSQTAKMAALQMIAMGKFLLIAAVIAIVVLAIQDFYKWMTDPTADTMMKRWFGDFDVVKNKLKALGDMAQIVFGTIPQILVATWNVIVGAVTGILNILWTAVTTIGSMIKYAFLIAVNAIGYTFAGVAILVASVLTSIRDGLASLATYFTETISSGWKLISDFFDGIINWVRDAINWVDSLISKFNFLQTAKDFVGNISSTVTQRLLGNPNTGNNSSNITNSGNQQNTFYITTNGSAEATAKAVTTSLGQTRSNSFSEAIDNTNPNYAY